MASIHETGRFVKFIMLGSIKALSLEVALNRLKCPAILARPV
jgi:hypothetical protein